MGSRGAHLDHVAYIGKNSKCPQGEVYKCPGGTPYNSVYRKAAPERVTFFRLQVYRMVGISDHPYIRVHEYSFHKCPSRILCFVFNSKGTGSCRGKALPEHRRRTESHKKQRSQTCGCISANSRSIRHVNGHNESSAKFIQHHGRVS